MAVPWIRIFDAVLGFSDLARVVRRPPPASVDGGLATTPATHALEKTLTGVVVAALKEAFDRDHQRLELERERLDAERLRAERALRAELVRQAADREIGRLRLLAGLAVASWLATLFFSRQLLGEGVWSRVALGGGWLLLLAALAAAFVAQSHVAVTLTRFDDRADSVPSSAAGALAPWLIVSGLAVIGFAVLLT
jgi:hypothetical protein